MRVLNGNEKGVTIKKNTKIDILQPLQDTANVVNLIEEQQITSENKTSPNSNPENKLSFDQAREKLKSEVKWGDCDLTREQQDRLLDVSANNIQAFSLNGELGNCDLIEHEIKLEDNG